MSSPRYHTIAMGKASWTTSANSKAISLTCIKTPFKKKKGQDRSPSPKAEGTKSDRQLATLNSTHDDTGDSTSAPPHQNKHDSDTSSTSKNADKGGGSNNPLNGVNNGLESSKANSGSSSLRSFLLSYGIYPAGIFWLRKLESNQHFHLQRMTSYPYSIPRYKVGSGNRTRSA